MAKKKLKIEEPQIIENINSTAMDELMGERFSIYAKDVIQDRAIPDARDGLKPVQRRIIYAMYKTGNTIEKPTKKCAHIVGEVMGKYHPHGDSSIYEALVRMSQTWVERLPLIDFQGNNGSMDGDGAAAYRYTEARLAAVSQELIRDIDKDTVQMDLTFDDTDYEPSVLPARFPNLFVNGTTGIAVGLATSIPPHNLREIISAITYRISHPDCANEKLMEYVKGPDFPTGGKIYETQSLKDIYLTGKGRVEIASKTEITKDEDGTTQIIVTEIPYGVNKSELVGHIDRIRHDKTIAGIAEVRDETDKSGLRIAIDLKPDAKPDAILSYLMNKTELSSAFSANMVAIVEGRPVTMTLDKYCDTYINHQVEVITKRSEFDLRKDKERLEIVEGLIKANSIITEIIAIIRKSDDKSDCKENLCKEFGFTMAQAEAIVMMPLHKLSHTDLEALIEEKSEIEKDIEFLNGILSDREKLNALLIGDLKLIAKTYGNDRRTIIEENYPVYTKVDSRDLVSKEDVMVAVSRDGYVKRSSISSYKGSGGHNGVFPGLKSGDSLIYSGKASTTDFIVMFTNKGNYLYLPVHSLKDIKWLAEGIHINSSINIGPEEKIIKAFVVSDWRKDIYFALLTRNGQIKRMAVADLQVARFNRPITSMKLVSSDEVVDVCITSGNSNLLVLSIDGKGLFYNENEFDPSTSHSGGVKAGKFEGSPLAALLSFNPEEKGKVLLVTNYAHTRVFDITNIQLTGRLGKYTTIYQFFKKEPHDLICAEKLYKREAPITLTALCLDGSLFEVTFADTYLTPMDRYAKKTNDKLTKKNCLEYVFVEGDEVVSKETIAFEPPAKPVKEVPVISENSDELTDQSLAEYDETDASDTQLEGIQKESESEEKSTGKYEQISIFGDDFE